MIVKGDKDMNIEDVNSAAEVIGDSVNKEADIMVRTVLDESMKGEIKVMVLLTKFSGTSPKGKTTRPGLVRGRKLRCSLTIWCDDWR